MPVEAEPKGTVNIEALKARAAELERKIAENERRLEEGVAERMRRDPGLRDRIEEQKKEIEESKKALERKMNRREEIIGDIQKPLARISAREFIETTPRRLLFDAKFMRYVPGDKYMALMEFEGSDKHPGFTRKEKERITEARFRFCTDWVKGKEYKDYLTEKRAYEEAFAKWLANPQTPYPTDENGKLLKEPEMPVDKQIKETFRNDIRTLKELAIINNYMPEIFDKFAFVGHIRFPMIQDIRKSEFFTGRGRAIRKVKVTDFYDVINHIKERGIGKGQSKEYFEKHSGIQLEALRQRMGKKDGPMKGKEKGELLSLGSDAWGSPITMDMYGRSELDGARADDSDKYTIAKHILIAFAVGGEEKMSSKNKDALQWLRGKREGHKFYMIDEEFVRAIEKEEGIKIDMERLDREYPLAELGPKKEGEEKKGSKKEGAEKDDEKSKNEEGETDDSVD